MNKDIIYIDTDDDITAIINKIKDSNDDIVALVPPKRPGILQSAVNLKLLSKSAKENGKKLVIVTNNKALVGLTAIAKIPVAKNLQSKPEIADLESDESDDGDDVIEGTSLPVGDIVNATDEAKKKSDDLADDIETIDIENEMSRPLNKSNPDDGSEDKTGRRIKVPDFSRFRKKLFVGIFGILAVVAFVVWAVAYAPSAKIVITAKTESYPISLALQLGSPTTSTDTSKNIVQTIVKQSKKDLSVEFVATGTKDAGDKATGSMTLSNANNSSSINVPAGSEFTKGDYTFVTTAEVNVPGATVSSGQIVAGTVSVAVQAENAGTGYNLSASSYSSSVSGVTAYGTAMTGGTTKTVKVVTASDIQTASQALVDLSTDEYKKALIAEYTNSEIVIGDSFKITREAGVPSVAIGQEAVDGKATLVSSTTFEITAIAKSEVETFLNYTLKKQVSENSNQRIYNNGIDKVKVSGYVTTGDVTTVNISTTGQIGPDIDEATLKEQIKGLRYGEVQTLVKKIQGVSNVDVKFSYFWVTTVPNDTKKITIEFTVENE